MILYETIIFEKMTLKYYDMCAQEADKSSPACY